MGFKASMRIDIVEIESRYAVGRRVDEPLELGRYGPYNRQVHYFRDQSNLTGTVLKAKLENKKVLTAAGQQELALNVVRTWNPQTVTVLVLIPFVSSLIISVSWSIVATRVFEADIQTSTQTAFTIGSYVVTAGALFIALVAFLESKYNTSDGTTSLGFPAFGPHQHLQVVPTAQLLQAQLSQQTQAQPIASQQTQSPQPTVI
jgi:hypothetical protein